MFELWQSFSEDAIQTCPGCGAPVKKVFSRVGISFKGEGFYKNDHGSTSEEGDAKPKASTSDNSSGSNDGKMSSSDSSGSSSPSSSDSSASLPKSD